jgi:hypothetical protein
MSTETLEMLAPVTLWDDMPRLADGARSPGGRPIRVRCAEFGDHKLVSTDTAGPESGSMGVECVRCGWAVSETLY